tara:strand:+ start:387 stop:665 length:279 start_codon:yes stop_codon:yes gene_type:complete
LTNPYELYRKDLPLTNPDERVTMVLSDVYKQKEDIMKDEATLAMVTTIRVLNETIEYFKTQLKPTTTGHIHTTINSLEKRVEELTGILTHAR